MEENAILTSGKIQDMRATTDPAILYEPAAHVILTERFDLLAASHAALLSLVQKQREALKGLLKYHQPIPELEGCDENPDAAYAQSLVASFPTELKPTT